MPRKKKYAKGGGVPKYTKQDSLNVANFRKVADKFKINPLNLTSFKKGTKEYQDVYDTFLKSKKMGDVYGTKHGKYGSIWKGFHGAAGTLKDTLSMKKGGVVKKGNRNMFTEQYD